MKIRLSTLLLLVGLIAACVGWLADRHRLVTDLTRLKESRAVRDDVIFMGAAVMSSSYGQFSLFERIEGKLANIKDDADYRRLVEKVCVNELIDIHTYQRQIEIAGKLHSDSWDARLHAREALRHLECDEPDQFLEIARSIRGLRTYHPRIFENDSNETRKLKQFISDTIAIGDQSYVGGFKNDPRDKR